MVVPSAAANYADTGGATALLIAAPLAGEEAERALDLVGVRLLARIGWDAAGEAIARHAARPVLMIEAEGASEADLAVALPRIDAHARALDLAVVAAIDEGQIDVVAAHLLGPRVELLCCPTLGDRVAALAVARDLRGGAVLHDSWRESEAVRLRRLNEEVARIADILARLARADGGRREEEVEDRRRGYDAGPGDGGAEGIPVDPADIRRAIRSRRLRDQFLGPGLFEDPAWDMLLDLYAAELEHVRVSVSSLCIAAAVAPTTALRWIAKMTEAGLFVRQPDPIDRRRAFMALAPGTSEAMRRYMAAIRRGDLRIA